ncbi:MAG: 2-C-methyl-D-erythritol 4-phosphate cytidylyltransferase [Vulcanimicrobiaceae bacterium]
MRFAAIVVAAGSGVRFGRAKQLVDVFGRPLVAWSFATFDGMPELADLIVATEDEHVGTMRDIAARYAPRLTCAIVRGGATRRQSVRSALAHVPAHCTAVFVHDGARPLVCAPDVRAGMALVAPGTGALLAAPVIDTIKVVAGDGAVTQTLDRATLWAAQTPQFATLADLRSAHASAEEAGAEATDDAVLLERAGHRVVVVPATTENFKVTLPGDRDRAEAILRERAAVRA